MAQRKQKAEILLENENKPYISTSVSPGALLPATCPQRVFVCRELRSSILAGRDLVARAHCLGHSPPSNLSSPRAMYTSSLLSYLISQGTKKAMHLLAEKPLAAT